MLHRICLFAVLIVSTKLFSQHTTILHRSEFRHEYLVSKLQYIEEAADTARMTYIATLAVAEQQMFLLQAAGWLELIRVRARELGANLFMVTDYREDDLNASVVVRFFFAPEKAVTANRGKRKMNCVYVFNQTRHREEEGIFLLDKEPIHFKSVGHYVFATEPGIEYRISVNESEITEKSVYSRKPAPARFLIVPANKNSFVLSRNKLTPNSIGFAIEGVPVVFARNTYYELNYDTGRFLSAVYR